MCNLIVDLGIDENEIRGCPECGAVEMRVEAKPWRFVSRRDGVVELNVLLPIWTCGACAFAYTDGRGEAIQDEAERQLLQQR